MLAIALAFLERAWPYLLAITLAAGLYIAADHWHNAAYREANDRATKLQEDADAANARATALALKYEIAANAADAELRAQQAKASAAYTQLAATKLNPLPTLGLSPAAVGMLDAATVFANASTPAAVSQSSSKTISEAALGQYALDAADAYLDAYTHWSACVATYEGIRNEQVH